MNKLALAPLGIFLGFAVTACSLVVNADRSKVGDDLYQPTDAGVTPDAEEPDSGQEPTAGSSGAAGAAGADGVQEGGASGTAGG